MVIAKSKKKRTVIYIEAEMRTRSCVAVSELFGLTALRERGRVMKR